MKFGKKIKINNINKFRLIFFCLFILQINLTYANWDCSSDQYYKNNKSISTIQQTRELEKVVIRAKIWKIHRSDGIFEMTDNAIENGFQNLIHSFKQYGILVDLLDTEKPFFLINHWYISSCLLYPFG